MVQAEEFEPLPAGQVHNPSSLAIGGRLPTFGFEIFKQEVPAGLSTDMQRHHHETVHYVISGHGHSEVEDETVTWSAGAAIYTPPWTWHRHYNDDGKHRRVPHHRGLAARRRARPDQPAERRAGHGRRGAGEVRGLTMEDT